MYSRAHLIIKDQLDDLMNINPISGIVAFPLHEDNLFDVVAKIEGQANTIWEYGVFQVYLKFSEFYNDMPPLVSFQTIPFHPNIDVSTGKPSVDFLDDATKWRPEFYTIRTILTGLQHLLSNPMLDRAVNIDAVFMLKGYPERYSKIARDSVIASQRIQKGLEPFETEGTNMTRISSKNTSSNHSGQINVQINKDPVTPNYSAHTLTMSTTIPIVPTDAGKTAQFTIENTQSIDTTRKTAKPVISRKRISFEDYHRLWKGIATSKPKDESENVYIKQDLNSNPQQIAQHLGLPIRDLELQMVQQINEHKDLVYGKFKFQKKEGETQNKNLQRIYQMKEVYMRKINSKTDEHSETNINGDNTSIDGFSSHYQDINGEEEEQMLDEQRVGTQSERFIDGEGNEEENEEPQGQYNFTFNYDDDENDEINKNDNWEEEVDELVNWTQNLNEQG